MAVGLAYLRATLGCLLAAVLLIPYLDRIYNRLTASENGREVKCSVSSGTVGLGVSGLKHLALMPAPLRVYCFAARTKGHFTMEP
jgi:hypothetical protein